MTKSAEEYGDRIAIKLDDAELSYALLDGASKHIAGLLHEKGFEVGDRVGIMLPNVPHFAVIYYGVLRLVEPGEFEKIVGAAEPRDELVDRDGDDTAVILYTSGTTGTPKGAELTHSNLSENVRVARGLFD